MLRYDGDGLGLATRTGKYAMGPTLRRGKQKCTCGRKKVASVQTKVSQDSKNFARVRCSSTNGASIANSVSSPFAWLAASANHLSSANSVVPSTPRSVFDPVCVPMITSSINIQNVTGIGSACRAAPSRAM